MSTPINLDSLKITREQADQIIIDWQKGNNPKKRVVGCYKGQWFDFRSLNEPMIDFAMEIISGVKPTKENTLDINL